MKKTLTFIGRDRWRYPVYEDEEGHLWKDIDCREGYEDVLYDVEGGEIEGDPDMPMDRNIECIFVPERIKDPHDTEPLLITFI